MIKKKCNITLFIFNKDSLHFFDISKAFSVKVSFHILLLLLALTWVLSKILTSLLMPYNKKSRDIIPTSLNYQNKNQTYG